MVGLYLDEEKENYTGQEISNEDDESSLLKSFEEEEDPEECVECGSAIRDKGFSKEFNEEKLDFCSKLCAEDYEESSI